MNKKQYYQEKYEHLILKAKVRESNPTTVKLEYKEKHHVLPKCMGGDDNPDNIVYLSHNEHVKAHVLLCKMYPNNKALEKALRAVELDSPARQLAQREKFIQLCLDYMESNKTQ